MAADGSFVAVAWSAAEAGGATDIFAAVSTDGAQRFSAPVRVNNIAGDARTNGEQPPRIVVARKPSGEHTITVVWTAKGTSGTKLVFARSDDGGRSFTPASLVPDSDGPGNRGWHNAAVDKNGRVHVVWLDHRELARNESMATSHHDHAAAGKPDGVAMAQKSKLFVASLDGATPPHAVVGGVCYCCKTAIAAGSDGAIYAAWRHVYPGNMRDIAFALSRDNGRTFGEAVRVSQDRWMLEGCPDDGPAMVVDGLARIHVVWPTLVTGGNGEPAVAIFYATSRDGRSFTPRLQLPTEGTPHHPTIALTADGRAAVAWDESGRGARRVVVARGDVANGEPRFTRVLVTDTAAAYPVVSAAGGATIAAYTLNSGAGSVIAVTRLLRQRESEQ